MGNNYFNNNYSNRRTSVDVSVVRETSTTEPVTTDEVKNYLRLDWADGDEPAELALITTLITTARKRVERYIHSDIVPKERQLSYPLLEGDINLMYAPIDTSVAITISVEGEATTEFETIGFDNPIFRLNVPGRNTNVQISYTTAGRINDEIK